MVTNMFLKGKLCRIVFVLLLCGGWIGAQARPFSKSHDVDTHRRSQVAERSATARSYLKVGDAARVNYQAQELEETFVTSSKSIVSNSPSYADFIERMKRAPEVDAKAAAEAIAETAAETAAEAAAGAGAGAVDVRGPVELAQRNSLELAPKSERDPMQAGGGARTTVVEANRVQRSVETDEAQLFRRYNRGDVEFSKLLMFFPTIETTNGMGGYNILTPVNHFDFFTAPTRNLPKSSARYEVIP